jgi:predicted transcriptional regulator
MGNGPNATKPATNYAAAAAPRHVLPGDLPSAIKHLDDRELEQLLNAVTAERLRRGVKASPIDKTTKKQADASAVTLKPGKLNAVRAALKAGVTPSTIAKEFGVSQSDVRKVIAGERR